MTGDRIVDAASVHEWLNQQMVTLVDVREADEFAAGHVPGAINLPLSTFDPAQVPDEAGKELVVMCKSGKRAGMALEKLNAAGITRAVNYRAGMDGWTADGMPVVAGSG